MGCVKGLPKTTCAIQEGIFNLPENFASPLVHSSVNDPVSTSKSENLTCSRIGRMHARVQQPCKFIGKKESVYILRKELNPHSNGSIHQHGQQFIALEHQNGCMKSSCAYALYEYGSPSFDWSIVHCRKRKLREQTGRPRCHFSAPGFRGPFFFFAVFFRVK